MLSGGGVSTCFPMVYAKSRFHSSPGLRDIWGRDPVESVRFCGSAAPSTRGSVCDYLTAAPLLCFVGHATRPG